MLALVVVALLVAAILWWRLRRWIGQQAMAEQPDQIELVAVGEQAWRNRAPIEALRRELEELGFTPVGVYSVAQLPGLVLELRIARNARSAAALYEDPRTVPWVDFWASSPTDEAVTASTSPMVGVLDPPPGRRTISVPDLPLREVLATLDAEAPRERRLLDPKRLASDFENEWAREIAWRKRRGVGTHEVDAVAQRSRGEGGGRA
jgi:hypothetical protein